MSSSSLCLSASEAARRLGVSTKALRLYEQRGLLSPGRTAAGYRIYAPDEMVRAAEIVTLRGLGLSLMQVARVLGGDPASLERALAAHETALEDEVRKLVKTIDKVRGFRAGVTGGHVRAAVQQAEFNVAFELPWPWGGERFELNDIRPINYIVGPLGSGKTRLARCLAENLPNAAFLGLERLDHAATVSEALIALLSGLEAEGPSVFVVDMVEQGLDHATQEAVIAHLRQRAKAGARPLFLMTRSSAILNLEAIGPDEAILLCPANHSPPIHVAPYPGAPGYEAVATCLASPEVRARTTGVIASRFRAA